MGTLHRAQWVSTGSGASRRQRASGVFYWFMPTRIADLPLTLDADVVADVSRAERALSDTKAREIGSTEGIARLLLRSEAISSSRIEGLVIGANRLLRAELQLLEPDNMRYDSRAATVLGNIHAMERAVHEASSADTLTVETICAVHRDLCAGTDLEPWGGVFRTVQNWVGGGSSNPLDVEFVPPAPDEVSGLMEDLVLYMNREDVSPVVQAGLCHAQFETIHPFIDGNGRVGRALIQICLARRGVVGVSVPPVSLALATRRAEYFAALSSFQHATDSDAERLAVNDWVSCFSAAVTQACDDMDAIGRDLRSMQEGWRVLLGSVRANSALALMLDELQGMPYFSVESMAVSIGRSRQAVNEATHRLVEAGIVRQTNKGKRSRVFEAPEVLEEFRIVERKLASPERDTRVAGPARPVPEWKG